MSNLTKSLPTEVGNGSHRAWPTARGNWLWGCTRQVQTDPLTFYRVIWKEHGDYVRIRLVPGMSFYLLTGPAAIEYVLARNHKNYRKPDIFNRPTSLLAGSGILTSEGEFWLRQRRLSQPAFVRNRLAAFQVPLRDSIETFLGEWDAAEDDRTLDIVPEMMRLALRIASRLLFSNDISEDADSIGHAFRAAFEYVSYKMNGRLTAPLAIPTRQNREFKQSKVLLDRVVLQLIEARRRKIAEPGAAGAADVLDMLLAAQDEKHGGMTDGQLKDEVITLLTAGHETIGAALSWAWYLLAQHPDAQRDLHDEAKSRLGGRTPTPDDLPHLPLATAVFEEAMRLYPPAWGQPRETIEPDEIDGYPLPAKAIVTVSQWITHRHPDYWTEPDRFLPERFLPGQDGDRPKFAYFPFGGGPRVCIGNHLAMMEGPLVLAALAQRFHFDLVPGHVVEPDATFTLRPKTGVMASVRKRD